MLFAVYIFFFKNVFKMYKNYIMSEYIMNPFSKPCFLSYSESLWYTYVFVFMFYYFRLVQVVPLWSSPGYNVLPRDTFSSAY